MSRPFVHRPYEPPSTREIEDEIRLTERFENASEANEEYARGVKDALKWVLGEEGHPRS